MSELNLNLLNSAPSDSPIINLIREIILLKFRIRQFHVDMEHYDSILAALLERLTQLESEYDSHRSTINTNDAAYFQNEIEKSKELIKEEYQFPLLSKLFPNSAYRTTKRRLEDQLLIKNRFPLLPSADELIENEEFIISVFR